MKITYFGDFKKDNPLTREKDIIKAFENLGHSVTRIDENNFDIQELIKTSNDSDLFFFNHGGVVATDTMNFSLTLQRLKIILKALKCKKVFWFFEPAMGMGENMLDEIIPLVDYGFLNDETYVRRHKYANIFPMHLAYGTGVVPMGNFKEEYAHDIVFIGNVYGMRDQFMVSMKQEFGDKFKIYNDKFGKDFRDVCESAKIIVSPRFPFEDFYWSDRVYKVLASRGFLIHPRLEGLKEEFRQKVCMETYNSWDELVDKIKFYLQPENDRTRKVVAQKGRTFVMERFSYDNRVREILEVIQ